MRHTPRYTNQVLKDIKKFPDNLKRKLEKTIKSLADDPFIGKPLMGTLSGKWSYRIGDFRITYEIRGKELIILFLMIGPRQDIYKRLLRFLEG